MGQPTLPADFDDDKVRALIEVMFLAAVADEDLGAEEHSSFVDVAGKLTGGRLSSEALSALTERIQRDLGASSLNARLQSIRERLAQPADRALAFTLAVHIANADSVVRTSERELLFDLAEGLEMSRDEAADIVKQVVG